MKAIVAWVGGVSCPLRCAPMQDIREVDGIKRIRFIGGWVSMTNSDGRVLVVPKEDTVRESACCRTDRRPEGVSSLQKP